MIHVVAPVRGYWSDVSIRDRIGVLSVVAPAPVEADGVRFPFHPYEMIQS